MLVIRDHSFITSREGGGEGVLERGLQFSKRFDLAGGVVNFLKCTKCEEVEILRHRTGLLCKVVTTYHPAVQNLKNTLMANWSPTENQPPLKIIFRRPPIICYKRGKSLKDMLVRAKSQRHLIMRRYHKHHIGSPCRSVFDFLSNLK